MILVITTIRSIFKKKLCEVSTFAFKALIFSSALLCLFSAAVLPFEELAQLLHMSTSVGGNGSAILANHVGVVSNVITPPPHC